MKIKILACVFAFSLTAFTVFAVLDTFVISRVYQANTSDADMFRQSEAALAGTFSCDIIPISFSLLSGFWSGHKKCRPRPDLI